MPRYQLMELPSETELRRIHFSGGEEFDSMRADAIKGCLWRAKLAVSGPKADIKERLVAHLESRYGSAGGDDAFSVYLRSVGQAEVRGVAGVGASRDKRRIPRAVPQVLQRRQRPRPSAPKRLRSLTKH